MLTLGYNDFYNKCGKLLFRLVDLNVHCNVCSMTDLYLTLALYVNTRDCWVWSGFNENTEVGTWYVKKERSQDHHQCLGLPHALCSMLLQVNTHRHTSHFTLYDQGTFKKDSDWIKAVMSSYHRIEGINIFVFASVINSTQEATRHHGMDWQNRSLGF